MQMKITVVGAYNTIVNFIKSLETLEYYSDIINIQIKQNEAAGNQQSANAGMFSLPGLDALNNTKISNADGDLAASIDVVFYTKK